MKLWNVIVDVFTDPDILKQYPWKDEKTSYTTKAYLYAPDCESAVKVAKEWFNQSGNDCYRNDLLFSFGRMAGPENKLAFSDVRDMNEDIGSIGVFLL